MKFIAVIFGTLTCYLASCCAVPGQTLQNIVVNSSFEEPVVDELQLFEAPNTDIVGWTVTQGSVDLATESRWDALSLNQSLDLAGISPGTIEQIINTLPGDNYLCTFVYANNPESSGNFIAEFQVLGESTILFESTFKHTGSQADDMDYDTVRGCFTADSNESLLRFRAVNEIDNGGIVIDSVFVASFVLGDINGDGEFNLLDVDPFVQCIQTCAFNVFADINKDGLVNLLDVPGFIELLNN